ncbi:hypothetical protein KCU65_g8917, partial [Aureobasidium melanogenum]
MAQSDQPPAYPTHAAIPSSSEATTATAYTPRYHSLNDNDDTQPLRTSRSLPPSRPLQRPDRLELTNQSTSTTINIGQTAPAQTQAQASQAPENTTTEPTKSKKKDGDPPDGVIVCTVIFCLVFMITWIYIAVFLKRDTDAFKENSKAFEELRYEMSQTKKTVTATLTAVIRESSATVTEKVTETVTQTIMPTADAWVTSVRKVRR